MCTWLENDTTFPKQILLEKIQCIFTYSMKQKECKMSASITLQQNSNFSTTFKNKVGNKAVLLWGIKNSLKSKLKLISKKLNLAVYKCKWHFDIFQSD